ncbi:MAG TPA: outer membrane lipid asymmetry maintenance protein MlaD [Candidatus Tectomicrobia bacterium]|jgi:phospholipid/cholesterol/gamma-HCH transport system substrate-binding protein|nr:outer membrane lipid asymmetry maintenance protein MlaD [Candidatus Tectomicrobia bacterium]
MPRVNTEVVVGFFLLLGLLALGYLAVKLGRMELVGSGGYTLHATFSDVGGLRTGSPVEIAGVEVGWIESITLKDYQAQVTLRVKEGVKLPEDSIISIRTKGLIGEQIVKISPGGSDKIIPAGGVISETEPPVDIMELIANYAFGKI